VVFASGVESVGVGFVGVGGVGLDFPVGGRWRVVGVFVLWVVAQDEAAVGDEF